MKANAFNSLSDIITSQLPGYFRKGRLIFAVPIRDVLRGFYIEDSDFSETAFYVTVFFLPLYVPTSHIHFAFGKRLRVHGGDRWDLGDPTVRETLLNCMQAEGLSFFAGAAEPSELARTIEERWHGSRDPYALEGIAYSLARTGEFNAAVAALSGLRSILRPEIRWQAHMDERAARLQNCIAVGAEGARELLDSWKAETVESLKLPVWSKNSAG